MHLVCRHRATALDDHGLLWTEEAPLTCANAGIDASHRVRRCNGAPLITQRSQVQILPPLQVKSQVRGPFSPRGGRASCVRDRTVTANPATGCGWMWVDSGVLGGHLRRCGAGYLSRLSTPRRTDLALDALEMGIWTRQHADQELSGLVHHSDRGVSTWPCATPSDWPRPAPSPPSGRPGTRTTTLWPRRSTPCSRPSWSATRARGRTSTTWRSPSPNTSTGSTTGACTARSG